MKFTKTDIQKELIKFAWEQIKHPEARKRMMETSQEVGLNVFHRWQVLSKKVNLQTQEEAIKIALEKCLRKDVEAQKKVAAFVIGLYLQHNKGINRAAQVGGSLLKKFGRTYFPHIKDRELQFALDVDPELEDYLYQQLSMEGSNTNLT